MTYVMNDDDRFYLQVFLEEALLKALTFYSLNSIINLG